jgi:hypothetical protein
VSRYGITHNDEVYTYEARAWSTDVSDSLSWSTQVWEWKSIEDDDGSGNHYRRPVGKVVADTRIANRRIDATNPRPGLDQEFRDRNWARLAGRPFLYSKAQGYWFAAMAVPNITLSGDRETDGLLARVAARIGEPMSVRELAEIRKAAPAAGRDDPDVLALYATSPSVAAAVKNRG